MGQRWVTAPTHDSQACLARVRRAERGIGLAIRRGQERGEIASRGDIGGFIGRDELREELVRPGQFFADHNERTNIYAVTDEQFEAAVTEARAERNLSRANVVRRPRGLPWSRAARARRGPPSRARRG